MCVNSLSCALNEFFFCSAFTVLPLLQQWTGLLELVVEGDGQTDSLKRVKVLQSVRIVQQCKLIPWWLLSARVMTEYKPNK